MRRTTEREKLNALGSLFDCICPHLPLTSDFLFMASKYEELKNRMKNAAQRTRESAENLRTAGETVITSGGLGYANGRGIGGEKFAIGPVPIDLGIGLIGVGASMYGGKGSTDALAVGVGGLSYYFGRKGKALGVTHKTEKDKSDADKAAGRKTEGGRQQRLLPGARGVRPQSPLRQAVVG